jgi:crotonobetainyl-CoA:carnitine CoA-transferase CaiB-like acyl-CoA transferase
VGRGGGQRYWQSFCEASGQRALLNDPHFSDDSGRAINCVELVEIFDKVFVMKPRDEWMEIFPERGAEVGRTHERDPA